jgi:hypothetical protein
MPGSPTRWKKPSKKPRLSVPHSLLRTSYDASEAFNDTFLAVLEAKPQLLMQIQSALCSG